MELNSLSEKYGWIGKVEGDSVYGIAHFQQRILSSKMELPLKKPVPLSLEIRKIARLIGLIGYLRFWNRLFLMKLRFIIDNVFEQLKLHTEIDNLDYATVPELVHGVENLQLLSVQLQERALGYGCYLKNGSPKILPASYLDVLTGLVQNNKDHNEQIQGMVACPGLVKGYARVVDFSSAHYVIELEAFREGEILITGMTRPQIIHLCTKAKAIVTDEGGVTSHAAVISRELNLPCIVGTHYATTILKSGDYIEVNAYLGTVHKVNK